MHTPPPAHSRQRVGAPLDLGVRALNTFLTCCRGQRMGIFAGSGVGKSVLLSMLARNVDADVSVIGLIGERGREVQEFLQDDLGEEGLARSVVVVATSDEPALMRRQAAYLTLAIAEYLNEVKPKSGLLPADQGARAHCRAICGEMHSGFSALRSALPMNLKAHYPGFKVWAGAQADIDRVTAIWSECLGRYGGPYLFGAHFGNADAFYAPVVSRFHTYDVVLKGDAREYQKRIWGHPLMREWLKAAGEEVAQQRRAVLRVGPVHRRRRGVRRRGREEVLRRRQHGAATHLHRRSRPRRGRSRHRRRQHRIGHVGRCGRHRRDP